MESTSVSSCMKTVVPPSQSRTDHRCRFYISGVTVIGLLVPSNSPGLNLTAKTAASSPFVLAIKTAGIKGLPSLINACLLTSGACTSWSSYHRGIQLTDSHCAAWSAASSDLYTSSRALCKSPLVYASFAGRVIG